MSSTTDTRIEIGAFDAVIPALDGVVARAAEVEAGAWKRTFDDYLAQRAARGEAAVDPFDAVRDYRNCIEGRSRRAGVTAFLRSRGIEIPKGEPPDDPGRETAWGLANRKSEVLGELLDERGVTVFDDTISASRTGKPGG